jgi:hypothetical protein
MGQKTNRIQPSIYEYKTGILYTRFMADLFSKVKGFQDVYSNLFSFW